ncbi:hypothetical protein Tco_1256810 [Tanacetum coccineum]
MVPLSNLIMDLAVVRNGVPKMKGLFSSFFMSKITKSMRYTCSATPTNTSSAIPKGPPMLQGPLGDKLYVFPFKFLTRAPDKESLLVCLARAQASSHSRLHLSGMDVSVMVDFAMSHRHSVCSLVTSCLPPSGWRNGFDVLG